MIQRLFSLILIFALLGSQAVVCCGHSHAGSSDHSSRTHIHLNGLDHHHHHHHDSGHHHDHGRHDDHHHHESSESNDLPSLSWFDSVSHDGDAVYFVETEQQTPLAANDIVLKKSLLSLTIPELKTYGHPESRISSGDCAALQPAHSVTPLQQTSRLLI